MESNIPINTGRGFHVLTKPVGPVCNLDCKYCFYLEKQKLYPDERFARRGKRNFSLIGLLPPRFPAFVQSAGGHAS